MNKKKEYRIKPRPLSVVAPVSSYEKDFCKWTQSQSLALKKKEYSKLDIQHLIEELRALGNSERSAIESYLTVLFTHLLKEKYQPEMMCKSWESSIKISRHKIQRIIKKNPSLKREIPDFIEDSYSDARLLASSETGLNEDLFPEICPWNVSDILQESK